MRKFAILLVFVYVTIFSLYNFVIAANPVSPFTSSQNIQDPGSPSTPGTGGTGCGPTDSNCYVTVTSTNFFTNDLTQTGNRSHDAASFDTIIENQGEFLIHTHVDSKFIRFRNEVGLSDSKITINKDSVELASDIGVSFGAITVNGGAISQLSSSANYNLGSGIFPPASDATPDGILGINSDGTLVTTTIDTSKKINQLLGADGTNIIDNGDFAQEWRWNTLTSSTALKLSSTSTFATANSQKLFEVALSGVNATGGQNTYGAYISNTHTGTGSVNYGIAVTASGGDNNIGIVSSASGANGAAIEGFGSTTAYGGYFSAGTDNGAIVVPSTGGNVGIGTLFPSSRLTVLDNSLAGNSMVSFTTTSTAATGNTQKILNIVLSGANSNASQTTYGIYVDNSHTGAGASNVAIVGSVSDGANNIGVYGTAGTGKGVYALSTSGYGVYGESTSSYGIYARTNSGTALGIQNFSATTNAVTTMVNIINASSGTAANGIGSSIDYTTEASDNAGYLSNQLISKWSDATIGTRTSEFSIKGVNSGATATLFTISGNGSTGIGDTTPDYLLDVENTGTDGYIFALHDSDGECLHDPEAGAETVTCSSDERLKTNIVDSSPVLDYLNSFRIRNYDVIASGNNMTGVIAQEVLLTHPELVSLLPSGMYSVQLPNQWKLVKGIQELDIKLQDITDFENTNEGSFVAKLRSWFGDSTNGIKSLFVKDTVCIGETCINEEQLKELLQNANNSSTNTTNNDTINSDSNIGDVQIITGDGVTNDTPAVDGIAPEVLPEGNLTDVPVETPSE